MPNLGTSLAPEAALGFSWRRGGSRHVRGGSNNGGTLTMEVPQTAKKWYLVVSWNRGLDWIFHYKPIIFGYPHLWKPPNINFDGFKTLTSTYFSKFQHTSSMFQSYYWLNQNWFLVAFTSTECPNTVPYQVCQSTFTRPRTASDRSAHYPDFRMDTIEFSFFHMAMKIQTICMLKNRDRIHHCLPIANRLLQEHQAVVLDLGKL